MFRTFFVIIILIYSTRIDEVESLPQSYVMNVQRVELLNATLVPEYYRCETLRVSKINRTTYGFNMAGDLYSDINENSFFEVDSYHKRAPDQPYSKSIFHWERMSFPERIKSSYIVSKSVINKFQAYSNLPPLKSQEEPYIIPKVSNILNQKPF